ESQTTFGTSTPPDGDIATSAQWMIQTTNDQVVMYNWLTNAYVQKNLPTLFQTSPPSLVYDPRVIYDPNWDRFIVLAAGCNPCFVGQVLWLAVSKTGDPSGAWWTWRLSQSVAAGGLVDFP